MKIAVLGLLLAAAGVQDPAKPAPFKAELVLKIEGTGPTWSFVIEGTTDLPEGTILKARVYALEEVDDFKGGKRLDEESLIQEGRGWKLITPTGGKFRETMLTSSRRPYSLWYRARVTYDPDNQDNKILGVAGITERSWTADLHRGTPKDLEMEVATTVKELTVELEEVQSLFRDLRGRFQVWVRRPDEAAFTEWRKGFTAKVDVIRKKNETRWSIWAVWLERQAKFRFESFCERFDGLCRDYEEWLGAKKALDAAAKGPPEPLKEAKDEEQDRQLRIMHALAGFLGYFEEAREALGIDTPTDPDLVGAILKEYEAAIAELSGLAEKKDAGAWKERGPASRERAHRSLMRLSDPRLMPRRAYDRVLELAEKFALYYDALERSATGEKPAGDAAGDHARLLVEFRKYAGVK